MRSSITILFLVLASIGAYAAPKVTLPETSFSTLQFKAQERGYLEFNGQIWITGTLVGRWITPYDETEANYLELALIPDVDMPVRMPGYEGWDTSVIF